MYVFVILGKQEIVGGMGLNGFVKKQSNEQKTLAAFSAPLCPPEADAMRHTSLQLTRIASGLRPGRRCQG